MAAYKSEGLGVGARGGEGGGGGGGTLSMNVGNACEGTSRPPFWAFWGFRR